MDVIPQGKAESLTSIKVTFPPWTTKMTGLGPVDNYTAQTREVGSVGNWTNSSVRGLHVGAKAVTLTVVGLQVNLDNSLLQVTLQVARSICAQL